MNDVFESWWFNLIMGLISLGIVAFYAINRHYVLAIIWLIITLHFSIQLGRGNDEN
jgi:hypothetical protein